MSSLTNALRTAQSGLLVNQSAMNAIANNVSNVNTEGYSRKVVHLEQRVVAGVGVGVQLSDVQRRVDEGLLKSMRLELTNLNELNAQDSYFSRIQELFGTPEENGSLAHIYADYQAALEGLSTSPAKSLEQSEAVRQAETLLAKLRDMSTTIQELRQQADKAMSEAVTELSRLANEVSVLNDTIIRNASISADVTDLFDQRDLKLNRMSELIDTRYFVRSDGDVVAFTSAGRTMVDNVNPPMSHTAAATITPSTTHAEGDFSPFYIGDKINANDVTTEVRGGVIKGLIDIRDRVLTDLQSQIDELAAETRDAINLAHNRGSTFPGRQTMTGTRQFVQPAVSTITYSGTSDTAVVLTNSSGDQIAGTTVRTQVANGSTVNATAAALQAWIRANSAATTATVAVTNGKLEIALNNTAVNLVFRDETASTAGSSHADATITFDSNGDTVADETVSGFSNFFGLNDFFVDNLTHNIWESDIIAGNWVSTAADLTFTDDTGTMVGALSVAAGLNRDQFAAAVNAGNLGVTATVVPDGSGYRLRFGHNAGKELYVTQATGNTLLTTDTGMHRADVRVASQMTVRADISTTPSKIATGALQYNAALGAAGEYYMSYGDDTIAVAMATAMSSSVQFDVAGGLGALNVSVREYAAAIIGNAASIADTNEVNLKSTRALQESLQHKSDTFRGVNLDEELAALILYEQGYSAAARIVSIIQDMFDALERII